MTTRNTLRWLPMAAAAALAAGCESPLSALEAAGPGAESIARIWWVMFWGSLVALAVMIILSVWAVLRPRGSRAATPTRLLVIGGGLIWPGVTITALLAYGLANGHGLTVPLDDEAFKVEIVGHQFWWEVRYPDGPDGETIYDANEIHIPAGRPVDFHITTEDVIHSFWIPRLGGKMDAIPGITNVMRLEADSPGVYRGVCAEFCGAQHARMGFIVEAHQADDLDEQLGQMSQAQPEPDLAEHPGAQLFATECSQCHSTDTGQDVPREGPNLARVAARSHLAAGWLRNDPETLRRWLREHQEIKPGNLMPEFDHLSDDDLDAVADYLEQIP